MNASPYARTVRSVPCLLLAAGAASSAALAGDAFDGIVPGPAADRWMYPFNATPGTKPTISTFGSEPGAPDFDSRDGQMLVRFDTGGGIPAGLGSQRYQVESLRLTVQFANDLVVQYDPTSDPWQCFVDPEDPNWVADADAGQPIELFGVGFRNGFSATGFAENSPYTVPPNSPLSPSVRNAFAMSFDGEGDPIDVSNNPRQHFDPKVWSVGAIDGLEPGDFIPLGSLMTFDLDTSDPSIQQYLRDGLDAGRLWFALTSLTFVEQQGGNFPTFHAKESALVILGLAQAARLEYSVRVLPQCATADFNCDGRVDGDDLGSLLGEWGACPGCDADLNGDGQVDGDDLGSLLGLWSS